MKDRRAAGRVGDPADAEVDSVEARELLLRAARTRRLLDGMESAAELRQLWTTTPSKLTRVEHEIALAERAALMSPREAISYARWLLAADRGWSAEGEETLRSGDEERAAEHGAGHEAARDGARRLARGSGVHEVGEAPQPSLADAFRFLLEEQRGAPRPHEPHRGHRRPRSARPAGARSWLHFQRPTITSAAMTTTALPTAAATNAPPALLAARMRPEASGPADQQAAAEAVLALVATDGPGEPLPAEVIAAEHPRFGELLGRVRVHTSDVAAEAAQLIGASAFTIGHDIYFAAGEYAPGSDAGDRLLRHELTHVRQHERGELAAARRAELLDRSSAAEAEARAAEETHQPNERDEHDDWAGMGKRPAAIVDRVRRQGQRIALPFRQELEEELGASFDFVETYTGKAAQLACEALGATAFVVQNLVMLRIHRRSASCFSTS